MALPPLTEAQILAWADDHQRRTGDYPKHLDGPILCAPGESWMATELALVRGLRGLPGGDSLAKLLARCRGKRNKSALPSLMVQEIKSWAVAFNKRTGTWPTVKSGAILEAPGETWSGVHAALNAGLRGLPGGDSLARLLARECGRRNNAATPPLTLDQIRVWARQHYKETGQWPKALSGPIRGVDGETWCAVALALSRGRRGLPGGMTLPQLVGECRDGAPATNK
jgi:hypothetical protein